MNAKVGCVAGAYVHGQDQFRGLVRYLGSVASPGLLRGAVVGAV